MKWSVHPGGYLWVKNRLQPLDPESVQYQEAHSGLFREFSETPRTREGIQSFANRHGACFASYILFDEWRHQIDDMQQVVWLWDAVLRRKRHLLREVIRWDSPTRVSYYRDGKFNRVIADEYHPQIIDQLRHGKQLKPATWLVLRMVNEKITRPSQSFGHLVDELRVNTQLTWDFDNDSSPVIEFGSDTLAGEMWLQAARWISSGYEYIPCQSCGTWFLNKPKPGPAQKYCSKACRTRAWRESK